MRITFEIKTSDGTDVRVTDSPLVAEDWREDFIHAEGDLRGRVEGTVTVLAAEPWTARIEDGGLSWEDIDFHDLTAEWLAEDDDAPIDAAGPIQVIEIIPAGA